MGVQRRTAAGAAVAKRDLPARVLGYQGVVHSASDFEPTIVGVGCGACRLPRGWTLHQRQGRGWLQEGPSAQGPGANQASWRQVLAGGFNKTTSYTGFQAANRFAIIQYPSADAWNKLWNGGLKDHQNMVGNKYADVRILSVESVEMK